MFTSCFSYFEIKRKCSWAAFDTRYSGHVHIDNATRTCSKISPTQTNAHKERSNWTSDFLVQLPMPWPLELLHLFHPQAFEIKKQFPKTQWLILLHLPSKLFWKLMRDLLFVAFSGCQNMHFVVLVVSLILSRPFSMVISETKVVLASNNHFATFSFRWVKLHSVRQL